MTTAQTTTSPARRATNPPPTPPLRHAVHHIEPSGVVHTLCGITLKARPGVVGDHSDKQPCAACTAAARLFWVMP